MRVKAFTNIPNRGVDINKQWAAAKLYAQDEIHNSLPNWLSRLPRLARPPEGPQPIVLGLHLLCRILLLER